MEIYLQSFGSRLRVRDGLFEVTVPDLSGSNYHVQEQIAAHQVDAILLSPGTSSSTDALLLALQNGVDVVVLDALGNPQGRLFSNRPSSTLTISKKQLAIALTPEGVEIAKGWVENKLRERIHFLQTLKRYRSADKQALIDTATAGMADYLAKIGALTVRNPVKDAEKIRGFEGQAGQIYFDTLAKLLPREYHFNGRHFRPAADLFNVFLNYGYGILNRRVEKALVLAGIHPYIGWMHVDGYQRKSLVYDFVEPYRIWVEKTVFRLLAAKKASGQHLRPAPQSPVGFWLNDAGKQLLSDELLHRLKFKKKEYNGRHFPLEQFLSDEARRLAAFILQWTPPVAILALIGAD